MRLRTWVFWILRYHDRQFWPLWFFYIPIYFVLPILALKHRSPWAWLYVDPALPNGGWWGESKSELDVILRAMMPDHYLPGDTIDPGRFAGLGRDEQDRILARFAYPVVAKPDRGKQGHGVVVVRDAQALRRHLLAEQAPTFVQTYDGAPGEAGLMFFRDPDSGHIELFSITDKHFPEVVADGVSTLHELILADRRARFLAPIYLRQCEGSSDRVPPRGERIFLTRLGNHSKGALFLDAPELMSRELAQCLDATLGPATGIDFGRLDIKYESRQRLMEGHFQVLELNGAGAESTNIHDPRFTLVEVYAILVRQWDLLFRLGRPHEASWWSSARRLWRARHPRAFAPSNRKVDGANAQGHS